MIDTSKALKDTQADFDVLATKASLPNIKLPVFLSVNTTHLFPFGGTQN